MKKSLSILLLVTIFLSGCIFEQKYDLNDPMSVEKMLRGKTSKEKIIFSNRVDILLLDSRTVPSEAYLQGMSYDEIINKSYEVEEKIKEQNINALIAMAVHSKIKGSAPYTLIRGRYLPPKEGYKSASLKNEQVIALLADLEGGQVSQKSIEKIETTYKSIYEEINRPPSKPKEMDEERYNHLIGLLEQINKNPREFRSSCMEDYEYRATTYGGVPSLTAREQSLMLCSREFEDVKKCTSMDKSEIINCLDQALPEPS